MGRAGEIRLYGERGGQGTHSKVSLQLMPFALVTLRDMFDGENWGRPCAFSA